LLQEAFACEKPARGIVASNESMHVHRKKLSEKLLVIIKQEEGNNERNYLMPRMSFDMGESEICIIGVHASNFFSSRSAKNLQEDTSIVISVA